MGDEGLPLVTDVAAAAEPYQVLGEVVTHVIVCATIVTNVRF